MHYWDQTTPVEEVLETFAALQRAGKIRYFGFSDIPAWYGMEAVTLARAASSPYPIALQLEYSLVERNIEREHIHMAGHAGLGVIPWGSLASGFLTGKYRRGDDQPSGEGRFSSQKPFRQFTDKHWRTLDVLREVAGELECPMAQVALAWAASQPAISALLIGASRLEQLHANLGSLNIQLTPVQSKRLTDVSALEPAHPYAGFTTEVKRSIFGGTEVRSL